MKRSSGGKVRVLLVVAVGFLLVFHVVPSDTVTVTGVQTVEAGTSANPGQRNDVSESQRLIKVTMGVMRRAGISVEAYKVDNGYVPNVVGSDLDVVSIADCVQPTFIKTLPRFDGWGNQLHWTHERGADNYSIASWGSDGVRDGEEPGGTESDVDDIVFSGGQFTRYSRNVEE